MHLQTIATNRIVDGFEFHVTIQNAIMPRLPMWYRRIRLRVGVEGTDAELQLVVSLRRNNTDIVSKDPRDVIVPGISPFRAAREDADSAKEVILASAHLVSGSKCPPQYS